MPKNYGIYIGMILFGSAILYGVFLFPALTSGGNAKSTNVSQLEFDAVVGQELEYCRTQPDGINCECFANISGNVLVHDTPRVFGVFYADQQDLARGQAANSC
jgi:hypothetical protein